MPRGKKNNTPVDDRTFDLATFGETEFNIPDQMVDKTKRGYKLVSPLTKTGKLTTRHGVPSIKLHPVHENLATVLSSKVGRYKLSEFVKQSKLQLSELNEKIIEAEVQETVLDLLQNVEIRNMVKETPDVLGIIVEAVENEVRNEIVAPVAAVKKPRKKAEPKKKAAAPKKTEEPKKSVLQEAKEQLAELNERKGMGAEDRRIINDIIRATKTPATYKDIGEID